MKQPKIYNMWRCAIMQNGKRIYKDFELIGDVENAYRHVIIKYGINNFRMVKPLR